MSRACSQLPFIVLIALAFSRASFGADAAEKESIVPQDVFDGMAGSFHADKAKGVHVRYLFELSGPDGGDWWIEVNDGTFKMGRGKIENPSVTYIVSAKDWVAISNGKLTGFWAYLTGRLKVRGDQALAKKMKEIFD